MKAVSLLTSFLGIWAASSALMAEDAQEDVDKIQGTWAAVALIFDGEGEGEEFTPDDAPMRYTFSGSKFTVTILGDKKKNIENISTTGEFKLTATNTPKSIDTKLPPAFSAQKERRHLGIYEFDGEILRICSGPDGSSKRPKDFNAAKGLESSIVVLKRLPK